jgi:eukaryotic-like serine/threonine-protein kinase
VLPDAPGRDFCYHFRQMALEQGLMLGPYEIEGPAGQGGMGEVYRARDTRLDRKVAIKILPADIANRPDRRARFEREARAIAALNHPNICALFDVGTHEGNTYLVMEFVEGETLAQAITRQDRSRSHGEKSATSARPSSALRPGLGRIERIYEIAGQIAEALEAAHRQGFIHRDLKPANIMLTRDGVKLLDFGLAKSIASTDISTDNTADSIDPSAIRGLSASGGIPSIAEHSRTATLAALTQPETVMGTLRYAAPEQLQGRKVDRRTDIFSFGTVLYEMLTGKKAFEGQSDVSLIAAILEHDPTPPSQFRPDIPAPLERLVLECLAKNADDRWQSAGDISRQLRALAAGREQERKNTKSFRGLRNHSVWYLAAGVLFGAAIAWGVFLLRHRPPVARAPEPPAMWRVSIEAPGMVMPQRMALSPNGRSLAYIGRATAAGPTAIFMRPMDAPAPVLVSGTEGASDLFWSPSGAELGFVSNLRIMRVGVTGGSTPRVVETLDRRPHGATWGSTDIIVYSAREGHLERVSVGGEDLGEMFSDGVVRRNPKFFPGGTHVMYERLDKSIGIYIATLDGTGEQLMKDPSAVPSIDPSGRGVIQEGYGLRSRRFSLSDVMVSKPHVRLVDHIETMVRDAYSISSEGTLAYLSFRPLPDEFTWVDRKGQFIKKHASGLRCFSFSLSRDENHLLLSATNSREKARDCHRLDLRDGTAKRIAEEDATTELDDPIWAPDGKSFVYVAHRNPSVLLRRDFATGTDTSLYSPKRGIVLVEDWSDDGKTLVAWTMAYPDPTRIMLLPIDRPGDPEIIAPTGERVDEIDLSPDGRWLVYQSFHVSDWEIVLQPRSGGGKAIHLADGFQPRFAADGKSIFFLSRDGAMMQVTMPDPVDGPVPLPTVLFRTGIEDPSPLSDQYRVSSDGERFLIMTPVPQAFHQVEIVRPWYGLLDAHR